MSGIQILAYGKVASAVSNRFLRVCSTRVLLLLDLSLRPKFKITVLVEMEVGVLFLRRKVAWVMLQPGKLST